MIKSDIHSRKDLAKLAFIFYHRLLEDEAIRNIFKNIAEINENEHIENFTNFLNNLTFNTAEYSGDVVETHIHLNGHLKLKAEFFQHWQFVFFKEVDELYTGVRAEMLKQKVRTIRIFIQQKLDLLDKQRLETNN